MEHAENRVRPAVALSVTLLVIAVGVVVALVVTRDSEPEGRPAEGPDLHFLLAEHPGGLLARDADEDVARLAEALDRRSAEFGEARDLVVDYPLDGSVFPPDLVPPTILWHDDTPEVSAWFVRLDFGDGDAPLTAFVRGGHAPPPPIDPEAAGPTNEVYAGTPYQRSAQAWTPSAELWQEVTRRSVSRFATLTMHGIDAAAPQTLHSKGALRLRTSEDPVGAPVFYRDVPLMPGLGEKGKIAPLPKGILPLVTWRLRDFSRPASKIVLEAMPKCANCHSFSRDGKTLGMDIDGPSGDKGTYTVAPIQKEMVIEADDVVTWNSFPDKPEGHKTIGFLSRVSPDGTFAMTTVNEDLYVANFTNYKILQVFYPTRGILAWYSTETGEMKALPGGDDPAYVHCNPVWTPDGQTIVFSRAEAFDPYGDDKPTATEPNDPNEPRIRYDLHRIPFDGGRGGEAVPIEGASHNGMSNTFPKISPDGKWIVYTKCRNGQLLRPDGKLWIVPLAGGEAREMRCNTALMNSWHSFSPNGRWMAFSSKVNTPYTQMFLTHIDEDGNDTPPILVPNSTAANRAVNLPEFVNIDYDSWDSIEVPAVQHHRSQVRELVWHLERNLETTPDDWGTALQLAWILSTSPYYLDRNGDRAVELAESARDAIGEERAEPHDVLAAAYAEVGRYDDAVATQRHAMALARGGRGEVTAGGDERLRRYEGRLPYRQPRRKP